MREKKMDLSGIAINFLGDSITEGAGASDPGKCYVSLLQKSGSFEIVRNYGIGGTRIAPNTAVSPDPKWDQDFNSRAAQMEPADIIAVFGGTNDFGHGDADFGELTDTCPETFCGAYRTLLKLLKDQFPEAEVLVITPLHREGEDNPKGDGTKKPGKILREYVDAILEIASCEQIKILNLYDYPPFPTNEEYLADGLHPNDKGHAVLAESILTYLKNQF